MSPWKSDNDRWGREAGERKLARLHDQRLHAYTQFLDECANAHGFESSKLVERYTASKHQDAPDDADVLQTSTIARDARELEHAEFNRFSAMRMMRCQKTVLMLTESPDVRDAARMLVENVMDVIRLAALDPEVNAKFFKNILASGEIHDRFVEAARIELTR